MGDGNTLLLNASRYPRRSRVGLRMDEKRATVSVRHLSPTRVNIPFTPLLSICQSAVVVVPVYRNHCRVQVEIVLALMLPEVPYANLRRRRSSHVRCIHVLRFMHHCRIKLPVCRWLMEQYSPSPPGMAPGSTVPNLYGGKCKHVFLQVARSCLFCNPLEFSFFL